MELFECLEKRFSCRSFLDKRISKEEVQRIVEAGVLAPTACNFQPERIIVVEDEGLLEKLKEATRFTFDAKTIFVICHDREVSWHRKSDSLDHGSIDSAIVATHMALASTALGLGSCFVCAMKPSVVKEILGLKESYCVDFLLPVGYPSEVKPHNSRKDLEEIVEYR